MAEIRQLFNYIRVSIDIFVLGKSSFRFRFWSPFIYVHDLSKCWSRYEDPTADRLILILLQDVIYDMSHSLVNFITLKCQNCTFNGEGIMQIMGFRIMKFV